MRCAFVQTDSLRGDPAPILASDSNPHGGSVDSLRRKPSPVMIPGQSVAEQNKESKRQEERRVKNNVNENLLQAEPRQKCVQPQNARCAALMQHMGQDRAKRIFVDE